MSDFRGFSEIELNREDNFRTEGDGKSIKTSIFYYVHTKEIR